MFIWEACPNRDRKQWSHNILSNSEAKCSSLFLSLEQLKHRPTAQGLLVSVLVKYMYIYDVRIQVMIRKPGSQMTRSEEDVPRVCFPSLVPDFISLSSTLVVQNSNIRFYGKETCKLRIYTCIMWKNYRRGFSFNFYS